VRILTLKVFPVVPMRIHCDACNAGLLNDPIRFVAAYFSVSFVSSSDPEPVEGERARDISQLYAEL